MRMISNDNVGYKNDIDDRFRYWCHCYWNCIGSSRLDIGELDG